MADVRALLAAERESRRISHPHLTYSKTGSLTCSICALHIKSEQLWPGHLKSLNHRKNALKSSETTSRPAKRKLESVEDDEGQERNYEVDSRKKPKSAPENAGNAIAASGADVLPEAPPIAHESQPLRQGLPQIPRSPQQQKSPLPQARSPVDVDEDEWAAFEREVAEAAKPDIVSATIEAAPVSAAELAEQKKIKTVQQREDEAAAEIEDESRRMEEEFDVMEEMEDRVRKLRARREALRPPDPTPESAIVESVTMDVAREEPGATKPDDYNESSEEEEFDDWYA